MAHERGQLWLQFWLNETLDVTAVGGIVDMAADVDIIGRIELRGGGIVDGMNNTIED